MTHDEVEKTEHRKNLNPFATDDDDDDSDGDEGDFTIGDLEVEEEGKGHLPPGTSLVGGEESLLHGGEKNVGVLLPVGTLPGGHDYANPRATFPSLWPFGGKLRGSSESGSGSDEGQSGHFRGARTDDFQSSDDEDSDEEFGGSGKFGEDGQGGEGGRRRLSMTTQAKRRTSIEDEDEDEVVHVAMQKGVEDVDDEELVEIKHAEMQGAGGARDAK